MKLVNNVQHKLKFAQKRCLWHGDPCHKTEKCIVQKSGKSVNE